MYLSILPFFQYSHTHTQGSCGQLRGWRQRKREKRVARHTHIKYHPVVRWLAPAPNPTRRAATATRKGISRAPFHKFIVLSLVFCYLSSPSFAFSFAWYFHVYFYFHLFPHLLHISTIIHCLHLEKHLGQRGRKCTVGDIYRTTLLEVTAQFSSHPFYLFPFHFRFFHPSDL
ncbi:unnamed protein product [Trypanosoma congolense IL3000]|uniref:WGS project CAEQ00000000 data, annotated contig 1594 n=1 Tax=Trypanosoma congolense (strain IL3000) TaxID=1068625 RepID=F9W7E4_TRYCI|nr:unnamed protein product [Trypanosoma congolense IL3000]